MDYGRRGLSEGWGNCLKGGGTEKRGGEITFLKRRGKLGQGGGGGTPLLNFEKVPGYGTWL